MFRLRVLATVLVVAIGVIFSAGCCGKQYNADNDDPDAGLKVKGQWEAGVETADGPDRQRD